MKIFIAGGTGAIGRPLIAELLGKGHAVTALTRSPDKAPVLADLGLAPAIADVFDAEAVKRVIKAAHPTWSSSNSRPFRKLTPVNRCEPPPHLTSAFAWKAARTCSRPRRLRACGGTSGNRSPSGQSPVRIGR